MKLSKLKLSLVVRDVLAIFAAFEAVLAVVAGLMTSIHLPQADVAVIAAISAGALGVADAIARMFGQKAPSATSLTLPKSGFVTILEDVIETLSPKTSAASLSTFLGLLTGVASFILGWTNPGATFTTTEQAVVSTAGLGFLTVVVVVHMVLSGKLKAILATRAVDTLELSMAHRPPTVAYENGAPVAVDGVPVYTADQLIPDTIRAYTEVNGVSFNGPADDILDLVKTLKKPAEAADGTDTLTATVIPAA
jgi:hypothetical protein